MTVFRYIVALALLALAAPATAQAAPACGATITTDTKLGSDLANCPGDGLVIGKDNVTLDLGRRTISGSSGAGIRLAGHRGVTIKGGTIQGFATGIVLDGAGGNRIRGVTVRGSAGRGIDLLNGSDGNTIDGVRATGNRTGIAVTGSTATTIRKSTFSDNAVTGVLLFGATRSRVDGNQIERNVGNGVAVVEGANDNRVLGNRVEGSETGLIVDAADRNLLALNRVSGGGDGILVAGNGNVVTGNLVDRSVGGCETCSGYGIGVTVGSANLVKANLVQRSAADGINVAAAGTLIAFNVALRNGDLGIEAVAGIRDGGHNVAVNNANPAQCAGVRCKGQGHHSRGDRRRAR